VFHHFTQLVQDASGWAYAIVLVLAFLDVLIPLVPSETSVITAGVVASTGALSLPLVVAAAALGAFAGDNTAYFIGWRWGHRVNERFFTSDKARERTKWAERQLDERGGELIIVGRFIPGGRTAVTLSAGTLEYPWRRFVVFDAIAATSWALYAALLGYVGGHAFEQAPWKGLIVALLIGFGVAGAVELVRWIRRRRSRSASAG
jgi:membrane protein DedA with SNARE-associated domain